MRETLIPPNSKRELMLKLAGKVLSHPVLFLKKMDLEHIKKFVTGVQSGALISTSNRLDNYLGGGKTAYECPEQIPVTEYTAIGDVPALRLPVSDEPVVSIIIPVYNQFAYTYACLKAMVRSSCKVPYEVIIADDCSDDLTTDITKAVSGIRVIRNEKNLQFILNCNHAAEEAKGKYLLFLNNDTQVTDGWLSALLELLESDEKTGMAGSRLIYPDGRLQEAGGIVWQDGSAWNYGHGDDPMKPEYCYVKEADYVSGASLMIRTELWRKLGGFDERFLPAYYEDTDLAFRVREAGYKVMYQPLSTVIHYEGISNGTSLTNGIKAHQKTNQAVFLDKWKRVLEQEQLPPGQDVFIARDRSRNRKHLLVIDRFVPQYDKDAGGRCTSMYLKLFVKMGFQVTFIGDNFFRQEPYTTELNRLCIEVLYGDDYLKNWAGWLKENEKFFDYVYLQRPEVAVKYIDKIRQCSKAKIIYFAHDLHFVREKREYEITGDQKFLKSAEEWKKTEYDLFDKADVGHVVGSYEQQLMQEAFPGKPIRDIPLYLYEKLPEREKEDCSRKKDLLFVGGFNHRPNEDAVLWFAREIFPAVLKRYPDIRWHVAGGYQPKSIMDLANEHILIHGFVSEEELEQMYRSCRIAVVPLRYGAGVKGKVIEACYYQIPLITTQIGAEGISQEEQAMVVCDSAADFAEAVCSLYEDPDRQAALADHCLELIRNHYTLEEAERIIRLDLQP